MYELFGGLTAYLAEPDQCDEYPPIRIESLGFHLSELFTPDALILARAGWPVFPCRSSDEGVFGGRAKSPLIRGGFKGATTDEETVLGWWSKWPDAAIGMPTGEATGVLVIDVDNKDGRDGGASLRELEAKHSPLPATRRIRTPSGGEHLYFEMPEGLDIRCSTDTIGRGIDVRANGGYVIVPPSSLFDGDGSLIGHYEDTCDSLGAPAAAPAWLIHLLMERPKPAKVAPQSSQTSALWAEAKLAEQCASVSDARRGSRNDTLNKAAFSVGQMIAMGALARGAAGEALEAAAQVCGLGEMEARTTINSGIEAGMLKPPELPFFTDVNTKGGIEVRSLPNVDAFLDWCGVSLCWNAFVDRYELTGLEGHAYLSDKSTAVLWGKAHAIGFKVDKCFLRDCLEVTALKHEVHPVRDHFKALGAWDGTPRLDNWLTAYLGADDTEYTHAVGGQDAYCGGAADQAARDKV